MLLRILIIVSIFLFGCNVVEFRSDSKPISHQLWDQLLGEHVSPSGAVDYKGFIRDSSRLNRYISLLRESHPNEQNWSEAERKAYWINAYNAFTVKLILNHYPLESIKNIKNGIPFVNSVWDIKFINIEGRVYDLNNLEHGILRKEFDDPRVHFALNCASKSCPKLLNEAYTAEKLDAQLDLQGKAFLGDSSKNLIGTDRIQISRIFYWYKGDFVHSEQSLVDFLNKFSAKKIQRDAKIDYLPYNWNLNE